MACPETVIRQRRNAWLEEKCLISARHAPFWRWRWRRRRQPSSPSSDFSASCAIGDEHRMVAAEARLEKATAAPCFTLDASSLDSLFGSFGGCQL